ncbi:hypothetical protein LCGC14_2310770 [marine sediment metagenome]|uniref:Uncharacterized protein n=1 Tax=marine sediment metagenome TaxID=412755 RepID=A0A0F9CL79_9ZZZZ
MDNNSGVTGFIGGSAPGQLISTPITWPEPKVAFRKSTNEIEGKLWFEMDVSEADTIVIIHEGKKVEMDKKDFLQRIGLEW